MRLVLLLVFLFYFICFFLRGAIVEDPDFGWHIQAGNHILRQGIPYTDPFSYSMPSYPFVDHEWLSNVFWSLTFNTFGQVPLLAVYTLLAIGSVFLQIIKVEKKWVLLPLFLAGGSLFDFVGIRTQLLTWFFLSILILVFYHKSFWEKWRFVLPVLFLFWANLHGGFGIGLGVLAVMIVGRWLEEKKITRQSLFILFLCFAATLINPFGIRLWWEFWMQLSDSQLRWSIAEWYPAFYFTNFAFWIYFCLSLSLMFRYWKRYRVTELFLYSFLLFEALASMRNIPIWVIISFAFTLRGLSFLYHDATSHLYGSNRFTIAYRGFCIIALTLVLPQIAVFFYGVSVEHIYQNSYPVQAVRYLRRHLPSQQIFSSYDWGGYLIWKLPEKKDFIDGRMPSWRWNANKLGESNYAFADYKKVLSDEVSFSTFAAKYHITTLLVPAGDLTKPEITFFGFKITDNSWLGRFLFSWRSFYPVVQEAKKMGWHEVYKDNTAVILEKK